MYSKKFFLALVALLFSINSEILIGQTDLQKVGKYQYAQYNDTIYTVIDGRKGDLVDKGHLIVRLKEKGNIEEFNFGELNIPKLNNVRGEFADGFYELEIPYGVDGFDVARKLEETGKFEEVLMNVFLKVDAYPNDQYYSSQWNLPKISMNSAWNLTTGSSSVIVAVIGVGGDYNHADLAGNKWSGTGYDFYNNDSDPYPSDGAGHGTAVAGIIGALTNNSIGVSGVAGGWAGSGGISLMYLDAGYIDQYGREWIDLASAANATGHLQTEQKLLI